MNRAVRTAALIVLLAIGAESHAAQRPRSPTRGKSCDVVKIASLGSRLEGLPDSGSVVVYSNRVHQVIYDPIPGLARAHVGDSVRLCLVSRPRNCPVSDHRGSRFAATDLQTGERWTAIDSSHTCGGA